MAADEDLGTWCDIADVKNLTGEVVDEETLKRAQALIDLFSGATFDSRLNLSPRNLRHLMYATAYQAAWINHHPDLFTHMELASIQAGGANATPGHENARVLSPLTIRALRRLTWMNKPLRVRGRYGTFDSDTPRDSAVADDNRYWTPMFRR